MKEAIQSMCHGVLIFNLKEWVLQDSYLNIGKARGKKAYNTGLRFVSYGAALEGSLSQCFLKF